MTRFADIPSGQRLLVTGGTGIFGRAIGTHWPELPFAEVRLLSRSVDAQTALAAKYPQAKPTFVVADVTDEAAMVQAMRDVDWVIHAAAMKLVPDCEREPATALRMNVLGTETVLYAAIAAGVERVIVISSDKAVQPTSAMGMTKGLAEKYVLALHGSGGFNASAIRFGNMMDSPGSVVPLFVRRLLNGEGLTLTDPNMTRFQSSPTEVLQLTLAALSQARGGEIFAANTGSTSVGELAQALAEVLNVTPNIQIIGARPGERLHEIMLSADENARAELVNDLFVLRPGSPLLRTISEAVSSETANRLSLPMLKQKLVALESVREALS